MKRSTIARSIDRFISVFCLTFIVGGLGLVGYSAFGWAGSILGLGMVLFFYGLMRLGAWVERNKDNHEHL